jgi:hypothetical protein
MKKRGRGLEAVPGRGQYAGAGVSADVKEHTAAFAVALQARGVPLETFVSALKETSYAPKKRTLQEHMAAIKGGEAPLSAEKKTGPQPVLTDEQWAIVFGWALAQEKIVDLETVRRWIAANLGINVSHATISRHKDEMCLSFQLVGRREMAPSMTRDAYVLGYFNFVQSLHRSGFFDFDPRRIICLDFVTDSRRRECERTLALRGGKQKKIARPPRSTPAATWLQ